MAQYPIQKTDSQGIYDALNYLLSGPAGLGQSVNGVSSLDQVYLRSTPVLRPPYTVPQDTTLNTLLYLSWTITDIQIVGTNPTSTIRVSWTSPTAQQAAPFQFGDLLTVTGATPQDYNLTWTVLSSTLLTATTGTVDLFETYTQAWPDYVSGGLIGRDWTNKPIGTDCFAAVTVNGATEQPFISAQISSGWDYTQLGGATDSWYDMVYAITRYVGQPSNQPNTINGYFYNFQTVISRQTFNYQANGTNISNLNPLTAGVQPLQNIVIFSNIFDGPNLPAPNLYLYELQVGFITKPNTVISGARTRVGALLTDAFSVNNTDTGYAYKTGRPGSAGTYTGITPILITPVNRTIPSGNRATVTVKISANPGLNQYVIGNTVDIIVTTPGGPVVTDVYPADQINGYKPFDLLAIPGSLLGGTDADNSILLQVEATAYPGNIKARYVSSAIRSLAAQVIKK
jgi:hypothetical protein